MKNLIASLKLRKSDLFLFIGFLAFVPFMIFAQSYMQIQNPDEVEFKIWFIIPCFIISAVMWGYYISDEFKLGSSPKLYISYTFIALAIVGVLSILIQPSTLVENVIVRVQNPDIFYYHPGYVAVVTLKMSTIHYVFFSMNILLTLVLIYIGLFILPKRFDNPSFLIYLGYGVLLFAGVLITAGYIMDFDKYISMFKFLLGKDPDGNIYEYTVKSFIGHRNAYGMAMLLAMIFSYINHSFKNKWWYYLIAGFLFINTIFALAKTALVIEVLMTFVYVIFRLIITYKNKPKRNKIIFIVLACLTVIAIGVLGIAYFTEGKFLGKIYEILNVYLTGATIDMRSHIWDNAYQLLRNGWWLIGRGYGYSHSMLYLMNGINGDPTVYTHSGYINLLLECGILYLLAYLALLAYYIIISYRCIKKDIKISLPLVLGALTFIFYSFIESNHYLVYIFIFPMFVLDRYLSDEIETA